MKKIKVKIADGVLAKWHRQCRAVWPIEAYGFLLGHGHGALYFIDGLWLPSLDHLRRFSTENGVIVPNRWAAEALEHAAENECRVLGDIHSHPMPFATHRGQEYEATPSEGDYAQGWPGLCGITSVAEDSRGRKYCRTRIYGPSARVIY
jgi:proteasome lid subunit RPN8/RPN11